MGPRLWTSSYVRTTVELYVGVWAESECERDGRQMPKSMPKAFASDEWRRRRQSSKNLEHERSGWTRDPQMTCALCAHTHIVASSIRGRNCIALSILSVRIVETFYCAVQKLKVWENGLTLGCVNSSLRLIEAAGITQPTKETSSRSTKLWDRMQIEGTVPNCRKMVL